MHSVSCLMRCKYSQDWLLATNNPDPEAKFDRDLHISCLADLISDVMKAKVEFLITFFF
jgi:hypothetical protein